MKLKDTTWWRRARPSSTMFGTARHGKRADRLAPRTTIRTKLHWSAGASVRTSIAYGPAFGIDGAR